jgi:DNA polymerase III epsilon subunit-like protein
MKDWVAVDIETTGLDPLRHGVCEIALVGSDGADTSMFLPITGIEIDEVAMEMNRYRERSDVLSVCNPGFVAASMESWIKPDTMVVCSPSFFDIGFLQAWYSRIGRDVPWRHRNVIDLKSYACGKWGTLAPLKNEFIGHVLGIEDTSDHTALADARWTAEMFKALIS